jgi:hypothetical protein
VNGTKVLDNWGFSGATELNGNINLPFGTNADLRLEMQQFGGDAGVRLMWTPPGGVKTIIPTEALRPRRSGLWTEYFATPDLGGMPAAASGSSVVDGDYGTNGPNIYIPSGPFSIRWTGRLLALGSGGYHFYLNSAGGARVYLDGRLFINDWTLHASRDATAAINLAPLSSHVLAVEYRNPSGTGSIHLDWQPPAGTRAVIPSSNLLPPLPQMRMARTDLAATANGLRLRWPADSGILKVLTTPSLQSTATNWSADLAQPYLSNGLWNVNLDATPNSSRFFILETDQ